MTENKEETFNQPQEERLMTNEDPSNIDFIQYEEFNGNVQTENTIENKPIDEDDQNNFDNLIQDVVINNNNSEENKVYDISPKKKDDSPVKENISPKKKEDSPIKESVSPTKKEELVEGVQDKKNPIDFSLILKNSTKEESSQNKESANENKQSPKKSHETMETDKNIEESIKEDVNKSMSREVKNDGTVIEDETPVNTSQETKPKEVLYTNEKRVQLATELKEEAKPLIMAKDYNGALKKYEEGLKICHPSFFKNSSDELIKQMIELTNMLLNNMSLCSYNLGEYKKSIVFAKQVLLTDRFNVKSYYRLALGYKGLEDYERAFTQIKECARISASQQMMTEVIKKEYEAIKGLYKEYLSKNKEKEQEMFKRMIDKKNNSSTLSKDGDKSKLDDTFCSNKNNDEESRFSLMLKYGLFLIPSGILAKCITHNLLNGKVSSVKDLWITSALSASFFGAIISERTWARIAFVAAAAGLSSFCYMKSIKSA